MSLAEILRAAESLDELGLLKDHLLRHGHDEYIFENVFSTGVLRDCIRGLQRSGDQLIENFYRVARKHRIDLLEVFFEEGLTLDFLTSTKDRREEFRKFIGRNVIAHGYVDVLKFFIEKGLDVNNPKENATEFMYLAIEGKKVDIIDVLLENGADLKVVDLSGDNPVSHAMRKSDVRILDRFIMYGADLFRGNGCGESLWTVVDYEYYKEELSANFQRIADMGVPLEKETYKRACYYLYFYPCLKSLVAIMHEVAKKQGFEIINPDE